MSEQRRHFSRIAFDAPAQLQVGEQAFEVRVLDLSLKGALIRLPALAGLRPALAAELRLALDEAGDEICMQTTVAHVEGSQIGLACQIIDLDSISHLRRLVELNSCDAELLQRELPALFGERPDSVP